MISTNFLQIIHNVIFHSTNVFEDLYCKPKNSFFLPTTLEILMVTFLP